MFRLEQECWRHAKAIGAWGTGTAVLDATGVGATPGVVAADNASAALEGVWSLLAAHRVWERFPASVA